MSSNRKLPALAALLALAGCGFTPLYGNDRATPVASQLDQVSVGLINDRPGQMLRQSLQDQLYAAGQPTTERYALAVSYNITQQGIGILADTSTTRNRFIATASWTLTDIATPSVPLTAGTASTENAANVIDQQYFALTLETNTINQQLADTIAAQITTQLAAYFKTHTQG